MPRNYRFNPISNNWCRNNNFSQWKHQTKLNVVYESGNCQCSSPVCALISVTLRRWWIWWCDWMRSFSCWWTRWCSIDSSWAGPRCWVHSLIPRHKVPVCRGASLPHVESRHCRRDVVEEANWEDGPFWLAVARPVRTTRMVNVSDVVCLLSFFFFFFFLLLLVCHTPLGMRMHSTDKRRHQSPEWTILSHVNCFIQGEVIGFEVLLNSHHPRLHIARGRPGGLLQFTKGAYVKIFWRG